MEAIVAFGILIDPVELFLDVKTVQEAEPSFCRHGLSPSWEWCPFCGEPRHPTVTQEVATLTELGERFVRPEGRLNELISGAKWEENAYCYDHVQVGVIALRRKGDDLKAWDDTVYVLGARLDTVSIVKEDDVGWSSETELAVTNLMHWVKVALKDWGFAQKPAFYTGIVES